MRHKLTTRLRYPGLSRGCVLEWCPSLTGPTGGTVRDLSPLRNHGTLTNMDPATDWVISGGRYSLDFDGVNDHLTAPGGSYFAGSCISVSLWCKIISFSSFGTIFELRNGASGNLLRLWEHTIPNVWAVIPGGEATVSTGVAVTFNAWQHIAYLHDPSGFALVINGLQVYSGSVGAFPPSTADWTFSLYHSGGGNVAMNLDDVRIYNRRLFQAETLQLSRRRGIAQEIVRRRHTREAGFRAFWARQRNQCIGGGVH